MRDISSGATDTLYRDQIRENVLIKQYYCDINVAHLISYDEELAHKLNTEPAAMIPIV
jgi:DNA replication licensing factor MCM5